MSSLIIRGPQICTPQGLSLHRELVAKNGMIAAIRDQDSEATVPVYEFAENTFLVPGMIDMHIHGAAGSDVMDATPEALQTISRKLAEEGVTGFLATTMTETPARIEKALINIAAFRANDTGLGAEVLGAHLEGPFLSEQFLGAQDGINLLAPDIALFDRWQNLSKQSIRLVTLAPERPGALALIRHLRRHHVIAALGHTGATYHEAKQGIEAGAHYATHLFNAMSGVHHRQPGAVMALLDHPEVSAELIVDGEHLHPDAVCFAARIKGLAHLLLVTDAMRAKCLGDGVFDLGGQAVNVKNGVARLQKNDRLAGSVLTLNRALKNFLDFTALPLPEVLPMVAMNQAQLLGLNDRGALTCGYRADCVVLSENCDVLATIRSGQMIYRSHAC